MWPFLKYLFQLILSPSRGWEDLSHDGPDPEALLQKGFYPLTGIASATQFLKLIFDYDATLSNVLRTAIVVFCTFFVAAFIGKLLLDFFIPRMIEGEMSSRRTATLNVMSLSVLVLIIIIASCVPGNLIISFFAVLPVYAVLIFYKASRYMAIRQDCESKFLCLGIGSVLIVPLFLYWILKLILMLR